MASVNPFIYDQNPSENSYVYVSLEQMVNDFEANFVGDHKVLNNVTRYNIIYWFKKAIQQFTFSTLQEIKAVELELGDTLEITLPSDYVNYVRISWLDVHTGKFIPLSENNEMNPFVKGYLQDHEAQILFDNDGFPLEGTSYTELINDGLQYGINANGCRIYSCDDQYRRGHGALNFSSPKPFDGTWKIDKRLGKIHFSSNCLSKAIILEYISDGLEYANSSDIKVNKMAEIALIDRVYAELLRLERGIPDYEKRNAEKTANTSLRNTKIAIGVNIQQIGEIMKRRRPMIGRNTSTTN